MSIRLEFSGDMAELLLDRAEKRNALSLEMWQRMLALLREVETNERVQLLVLRSAAGGAFSAGADISEMVANKDDERWRSANQAAINTVQSELARLPVPTLAFVEGDCIGGGCGLALACDIRVATPAARFGITPAKLGLVYPLHDVKLLVDLVGPGQAKRMLFTGALLDAEEAARIGLVEVVADEFADIADMVLAASPHSAREAKKFVRRVLEGQSEDDEDTLQVFADAFDLPDFREGSQAFMERRKPVFRRGSD
ncbi:enoyl-CoA hydratase/isomerase family protein [Qipengyuania atrilutea]|uniref:Enoyl-CoA hydratase/isomerase family protein n=1 Tax=Qipengyuania atrilutea TaxID=2744473 RepID=A0A850GZT3_9SPHN|nr:enoyl-CoA hydratase-related protein [Actirhodobacter atriluteus]NVD45141.1 enoyl-CoA hydratase/isomerase family protein [Actirhodobacter atriluteus]